MKQRARTIRRSAAVLLTAGVAAGILGAGWTGSAGAGVSRGVREVEATPPPPGSGVVVEVVVPEVQVPAVPEPIGPRSLT